MARLEVLWNHAYIGINVIIVHAWLTQVVYGSMSTFLFYATPKFVCFFSSKMHSSAGSITYIVMHKVQICSSYFWTKCLYNTWSKVFYPYAFYYCKWLCILVMIQVIYIYYKWKLLECLFSDLYVYSKSSILSWCISPRHSLEGNSCAWNFKATNNNCGSHQFHADNFYGR